MAWRYPNAALGQDGFAPDMVQLNGSPLPDTIVKKLTSCSLSRDITQASTVTLTCEDDRDRAILGHPAVNQASILRVGVLTFTLVKVGKKGNGVTLTFEDSVIHRLRGIQGQLSVAPNTMSRVDFAARLCAMSGVPFIAPFGGQPLALEPLSRGSSQDPTEDNWSCLTRIANDIQYRCFSDGTSILFGPDSWLFNPPGGIAQTITEFSDGVDYIDGDYDVGKPEIQLDIYTYADKWQADPGALVQVNPPLGPLAGTWIVSSIQRDLFHSPVTVQVIKGQPSLPEPANQT